MYLYRSTRLLLLPFYSSICFYFFSLSQLFFSHSFLFFFFFFFNDTATTEIYTLSLHDALPISNVRRVDARSREVGEAFQGFDQGGVVLVAVAAGDGGVEQLLGGSGVGEGQIEDRKSTRLNSSHANISYAVFCLKKKNTTILIFFCPEQQVGITTTLGVTKEAITFGETKVTCFA